MIVRLGTVLSVFIFLSDNGWSEDIHHFSVEQELQQTKTRGGDGDMAVTFAFAKHFQDHMVLQQAPARANIYGFTPGSVVGQRVTLLMMTPEGPYRYQVPVVQGRAEDVGEWLVTLDPMEAGYTVTITADLLGTSLNLSDVIFGDVWLCSGQSNMQFTVIQMFDAEDEIADAHNYPDIRLMTVAMKTATTPQYDLIEIEQKWTTPDNASVGGPAWGYFSAVCWLYGKAIYKSRKYPIGLIATDWGGTPVEAWSSPDALASCGVHSSTSSEQPDSFKDYLDTLSPEDRYRLDGPDDNSVLWNSMIHPFLNMTIFGAIWYQGESDASGAMMNRYNCTFPAMIRDWRTNFNSASKGQTNHLFPFGFVQLAADRNNSTITQGFPDIRWHQTADLGYVPNDILPNVFMAVAMDLPDFNSSYGSVHPRNKKDVGDRLALSGLAVAYGQTEIFQGPFPQKTEMGIYGLQLSYGDAWHLDIRAPTGFEYQCSTLESNTWQPTSIIGYNDTAITLQWNICNPNELVTALRYAWRESPCQFQKCAIYETVNGLPAPPFVMNGPFY